MPNYTEEELVQPTADILLRIAATERVITYGDAAEILSARIGALVIPLQMGNAVGAMMGRMLNAGSEIPPLNALMVGAKSREPLDGADGFISDWLGRDFSSLSAEKRKRALGKAFRAVWSFGSWAQVYRTTFGESPSEPEPVPAARKTAGAHGGPAESEEHRRLRLAVTKDPAAFLDLRGQVSAVTEKRLLSGDEIDVHVTDDRADYAIEVKSRRSSDSDLERGVYQAVKYRSVLRAQYKAVGAKSNVKAVLIAERELPKHLKALAVELKVSFQLVDVN